MGYIVELFLFLFFFEQKVWITILFLIYFSVLLYRHIIKWHRSIGSNGTFGVCPMCIQHINAKHIIPTPGGEQNISYFQMLWSLSTRARAICHFNLFTLKLKSFNSLLFVHICILIWKSGLSLKYHTYMYDHCYMHMHWE